MRDIPEEKAKELAEVWLPLGEQVGSWHFSQLDFRHIPPQYEVVVTISVRPIAHYVMPKEFVGHMVTA